MTEFYIHPQTTLIQPDRRRETKPAAGVEKRNLEPVRTTALQFEFLRDALLRKEADHDRLGIHERRARHLLVLTAVIFVTLVFGAPTLSVSIDALGVKSELQRAQILAAFPVVIAYLMLFACYLGARRLRLRHECRVISLELERFGCPTNYETIGRYFSSTCGQPPGFWKRFFLPGPYEAIFRAHDLFLFLTAVILVVAGFATSRDLYRLLGHDHPGMTTVFLVYLALSGLAALVAPLVLRFVRTKRRTLLANYEAMVRGRFAGRKPVEKEPLEVSGSMGLAAGMQRGGGD